MIREYRQNDCSEVLSIWLSASIEAHNFIDANFWKSQVDNMRSRYLPASESYIYEMNSKIIGFYSLYENSLAAIFVASEYQGRGVGKELLNHAKKQRDALTLTVYVENNASYRFYLSQGFTLEKQQTDQFTGHEEYLMSYK